MSIFRKPKEESPAAPIDSQVGKRAMADLRLRALTVTLAEYGRPVEALPPVWMAMMEEVYTSAVASLVSFEDGTTSLYFSHGGGILGSGVHEPVAQATGRFLGQSYLALSQYTPTTEYPLPEPGTVRFYCRTPDATYTAVADGEAVTQPDHPLYRVFMAAHQVITQIRLHTEDRGKS